MKKAETIFFDTEDGKMSLQLCTTKQTTEHGILLSESLCLCVFEEDDLTAVVTIQETDILPIISKLTAIAEQLKLI